ncbi:T9SS-dependent choice-of-anchor J family protein [Flammeovirga sp. OC4]|uniref:T9SS-dependent choice-of-anchor J family protein n=1 Tax=Flammeovirga sp. OC4 TaxID=1382345 RepID=UPI0009E1E70C|nr:choice-of-anchor J domain-containing protein [Flammeovirga sp. OC4]
MKRLLWFPLVVLFCIGQLAYATEESAPTAFVEIGAGQTPTTDPIYSSWKYAWGSFLYKSDDLGEAKTISKISFYGYKNFGGWEKSFANQQIYISLVSRDDVPLSYPDLNNYTKVFDGTVTYPPNGADWMDIDIEDFEYDGTSDIIIHWQNHSGESYVTSGLFYGTVNQDHQAVSGSDNNFPTGVAGWRPFNNATPNIRFHYLVSNDTPCTPLAISPENKDTKVKVDQALEFSLCNSDRYDFYLGTEEDNMQLIVSDQAITEDGTYTYNSQTLWESKKTYYYKVVAKKGDKEISSPIISFTAQKFIEEYPFIVDFEDFYISQITGNRINRTINTNFPDDSDWEFDEYWSTGDVDGFPEGIYKGEMTGYVSAWRTGDYSLITPRMNLPENSEISFYWRTGSNSPSSGTYLEISTDGKETWSEVASMMLEGDMEEYKYESFSLGDYSGENVYIRFRYHETSSWSPKYFWIDDIVIKEQKMEPEIQIATDNLTYASVSVGSKISQSVTVTNTGKAPLIIRGGTSTGPFSTDYTGTIDIGKSADIKLYFEPTSAGDFENVFTFESNATSGTNDITLKGNAYQPLTDFFENFDNSTEMPAKWSQIRSSWDNYTSVQVIDGALEYFTGPHCARLMNLNDFESNVILVSPGVKNFDTNRIVFQAKKSNDAYDLTLEVGLMTDPTDSSTFVLKETFELTSAYKQFNLLFSHADKGPYIAFRHGGREQKVTAALIDDISWEKISNGFPLAAVPVSPVTNAVDVDIMKGLKLAWNDGGGATEGYKINVGTDYPPTNMIANQEVDLETAELKLENLEYNTQYYWQVVPYNSNGELPNAPVWSFTTIPDPTVETLPYLENFETMKQGTTKPMGWSIDDLNLDGNEWKQITDDGSNDLVKGSGAMQISGKKDDILYSVPLALEKGTTYDLSFSIRTELDELEGKWHTEELEVYLVEENKKTALGEEALVKTSTVEDAWKDVSVTFEAPKTKSMFLAFYAKTESATGVLTLDNVELDIAKENPITFTSTPVETGAIYHDYSYVISASHKEEKALEFSLEDAPEWLSIEDHGDGTATLSGKTTKKGTYYVRVNATSGEQSASHQFNLEIEDIDNPLAFTSVPELSVKVYGTYEYAIEVDCAIDEAITLELVQGPQWLSLEEMEGKYTLSGTPDATGSNVVTLKASVASWELSQSYSLKVEDIDNPLMFTSGDSLFVMEDESFEHQVAVEGLEGLTISLALKEAMEGVELMDNNDGTATLTGSLMETSTVVVVASQSNWSIEQEIVVTVEEKQVTDASLDISTIMLYPNPMTDQFILKGAEQIESVYIYSLIGEKVKAYEDLSQAPQFLFNVSDLVKGWYVVQVNSGGATKTYKIQKQ